jgi:hypothetical protein
MADHKDDLLGRLVELLMKLLKEGWKGDGGGEQLLIKVLRKGLI